MIGTKALAILNQNKNPSHSVQDRIDLDHIFEVQLSHFSTLDNQNHDFASHLFKRKKSIIVMTARASEHPFDANFTDRVR
jgi:hypothetical protein